jgi:hypothetical protein
MTFAAVPALSSALALRRSPRTALPETSGFLPPGVLLLIRIVAGDETAIAEARLASAEPIEVLREASGFYLQQILFAADANSYRVLGVNPGEEDARIREHYRWLARWLHPDRNPDEWEVVYADRVSNAWQNLRTPERRVRYDEALGDAAMPTASPVAPVRVAPAMGTMPVRRLGEYEPPPTPINLRWLPPAILGLLGVAALGVVFLYILRVRDEAAVQVAVAGATAAPEVRLAPVRLRPTRTPATAAASPPQVVEVPSPLVMATDPERVSTSAAAPAAPTAAIDTAVPTRPIAAQPVMPAAPPPRPIQEAPAPRAASRPEPTMLARRALTPSAAARPAREVPDAEPVAVSVAVAASGPVSEAAPAASVPTAPRIRQADANRLLGSFSRAFEQGDLQQMRELFAVDARGPQGGLREILRDYDRVFGDSSARSLVVRDVNWFEEGENVTIVAGYDASVTSRGGKARRTRGDLRLDIRRENDRWRIYRLRHDERPG